MKFRFAVGQPLGPKASAWKLFSQKRDVYLLQRSIGEHVKFSFHASRRCRWALCKPRSDGSDRVMFKWVRNPLSEPGAKQGQLLVSIAVPTNHLSTQVKDVYGGVHWIRPAEPGRAVMLSVVLTRESETYVRDVYGLSGNGTLVHQATVEGDARVCLLADHFDCGLVDITVPGEPRRPGQVFGELMFPERDVHGTGRPVRMLFSKDETMPPTMWDLGGYRVESIGKIEGAVQMTSPLRPDLGGETRS